MSVQRDDSVAIASGDILHAGMTAAQLDRAYDNRAFVRDSAACLARWAEESRSFYCSTRVHRDLRYGSAPRCRLDFFPADRSGQPTLFFVHGGYWQWCDKEDEAFVARGPAAHGVNVVNVEYTLCPDIRIEGIVAEIHAALDWLVPRLAEFDADSERLIVAGSSAGAHLAAMTLGRPDVKAALLVSGIYDLVPISMTRFNEALCMDVESARRNSPLRLVPAHGVPVCFAVGGNELPEMIRQTREYRAAWEAAGYQSLPGTLDGVNHFTIMDELSRPDGRLTHALLHLLRLI